MGKNKHHEHNSGGGIIGLVILIVIGWWIWNHWIHKPTWTAVYYPNAGNLNYFADQKVSSLEDCRDWVSVQAQAQNNTDYDYECGTNCKLQHDNLGKFYRCNETKK